MTPFSKRFGTIRICLMHIRFAMFTRRYVHSTVLSLLVVCRTYTSLTPVERLLTSWVCLSVVGSVKYIKTLMAGCRYHDFSSRRWSTTTKLVGITKAGCFFKLVNTLLFNRYSSMEHAILEVTEAILRQDGACLPGREPNPDFAEVRNTLACRSGVMYRGLDGVMARKLHGVAFCFHAKILSSSDSGRSLSRIFLVRPLRSDGTRTTI